MNEVKAVFVQYWDESLFEGWLNSSNAHLNNATPAQFIAARDISRVIDAIESAAWGVYS